MSTRTLPTPPQAWPDLRGWNLYFLSKVILTWMGALDLHVLPNLLLLAALLVPLPWRRARIARTVVAIPVAVALYYQDTWWPPFERLLAQPGVLDFSDIAVNPATGAVDLRAVVPNPDRTLLPGMYVTLKAQFGQQHKVFLIPQQAVLRDTVGAYVMVVGADGKVARKDVTLGGTTGSKWVVRDGLQAGDQVVVSGIQNAKVGEPAKPTAWQPASGSSSAQPPAAPNRK